MANTKAAVQGYLQEGILALVPVYHGGGNACHIYTRLNDYRDSHTINWVLSLTAAYYGSTIRLLQQVYGPVISRTNTIPLPLSRDIVLLPLKMRESRVPGDTTIGYLNSLHIDGVEPANAPYRSLVHFREGLTLPCFTAPATVRKHLLQGGAVHREFLRRQHANASATPAKQKGMSEMTHDEFFNYALELVLARLTEVFTL